MKPLMKLGLPSTLAVLASAIVFSSTAFAQNNYRNSNNYSGGVTVYEHCDFGGKSQTFRPGEYRSLRDAGFGNDRMSSIRVPRGFEAVIYQDDDYRGSYARIDKDIRCFDRQWNDKASSISVRETGYSDRNNNGYNNRNNGARNDRYNNQDYDGRDYDNRNNRRGNNNRQSDANVTAKNVAQVVFDGSSLQQVSKTQWSMDSNRGASKQFDEVRRDRDSVYLENKYTSERVRIDLFANDVTFVGRDGRQKRFNIQRKNAVLGSAANPNSISRAQTSSQNRTIRSECFNFKAYTTGGNASVRFFNSKKELFRFNRKASTGRICHKGSLTVEIGKTAPSTDVTVEINGNRYRFAAGEKEDKYLNNWYRKTVKLSVGR